jgi:hypothetical protein
LYRATHINLFVAEVKSYGSAFECAQELSSAGAEILEIGPVIEKGYLLAELPKTFDYEFFHKKYSSRFNQSLFLPEMPIEILNSYLSISVATVGTHMVFLSFQSLCLSFKAAMSLQSRGFKIIDFRFLKNAPGMIHLILSVDEEKALHAARIEFPNAISFKPNSEFIKNYFKI